MAKVVQRVRGAREIFDKIGDMHASEVKGAHLKVKGAH